MRSEKNETKSRCENKRLRKLDIEKIKEDVYTERNTRHDCSELAIELIQMYVQEKTKPKIMV